MIRRWRDARRAGDDLRVYWAVRNHGGLISGYEIRRRAGIRSARVYRALDRLMERRWITDTWETGTPIEHPARRFYRATHLGGPSAT